MARKSSHELRPLAESAQIPAGYRPWITPALIEHTQRVWSRLYRRPLTVEEALEILGNVGRLIEVIAQPARPDDAIGQQQAE